jgi:UDPglucose 6-dehydrogenase
MRIGVIGAGYVGLVAGTCLAEMGNHVCVADVNEEVIRTLRAGRIHYFEPGLAELVERNSAEERLVFTTDTAELVARSSAIFLAVGTPQGEDGQADLSYMEAAARAVAEAMDGHRFIINKSTVPVGTNRRLAELIGGIAPHEFDVISNPEFLKEGAAIDDFMYPDRIVVGVRSRRAEAVMREIYAPFLRTGRPLMVMDPESAEMTKYVSNALLASRISFMNEMANLCQAVGADIDEVRQAVGADRRIGASFLFPGLGYGGSCFPKDVRALAHVAAEAGVPGDLCDAIDRVNVGQRTILLPAIEAEFGTDLAGATFAIWGLAFKPKTDDVREAPAIYLIRELLGRGASVRAYDPEALQTAAREPGMEAVQFVGRPYEALDGADALVVATEWNEFRSPDFDRISKALKRPLLFDGRNIYDGATCASHGLTYHSVGRPCARPAVAADE